MKNALKQSSKMPKKPLSCLFLATFLLNPALAMAFDVDMAKIAYIESSNNPNAFNKSSGAVGLVQITKPVLIEYNQRCKTSWQMKDLFNADLNLLVGTWYMQDRIPQMLKHFKIKDTVRNRLWAYNAGIGMVKKGIMPNETRNYIVKYEAN